MAANISNPDCEIATTRVFNFPRALVFKAWTDPNHLKNWWGRRVLPTHSTLLISA
ncbi:SRPBCC domain-containing protein [Flavobacterium sp. 3HN19-14]|uniref:SRPBCC domain-containing protein n=1 Tax=Flavobacterium sp. 3HN19-14 TaxID=3448133 RepID=UPI003EE1C6CD